MPPEIDPHRSAEDEANALSASPIIAVVGSLMRDIIFETERVPKLGESVACTSFTTKPAGKGANIAVAVYRASHIKPESGGTRAAGSDGDGEIRVFMNGCVGDDEVGPSMRKDLEEKGIDVTGIRVLPGVQTGQAAIILDKRAKQSSQLGFKGANLLFRPREENVECLAGDTNAKPDVLITHCTMDMKTVEQILEMAHRSGVVTMLSASPAVPLQKTTYSFITHIILNEHEAAEMSSRAATDFADVEIAKEEAARFVELGVKYAVITLGEAGAVYATYDNASGHVPSEKNIDVVDTTGAGDSFLGAYAVNFIHQDRTGKFNINEAVSFANKAAARTITQIGSQTSLPWADETGDI